MASLLKPAERARIDRQFAAVRQMPVPIPPGDRFRFSIEQVRIGGYIRFEAKTYRVAGMNAYERQGVRWPELILYRLDDGDTKYLEWEKEDELSVYVSRETLSFGQIGVRNKEHLWEMSEAEEGSVRFRDRTFHYHEDSAVLFLRDGKGSGKPFHQYLFASSDRKAFVGVEEWGSESQGYEHNVILSGYLDPKAIEVLATEGPVD